MVEVEQRERVRDRPRAAPRRTRQSGGARRTDKPAPYPTAAERAVVIDAMLGLITFRELERYHTVNRADWPFFMGAGLGILFFGIIQGILIGVVFRCCS